MQCSIHITLQGGYMDKSSLKLIFSHCSSLLDPHNLLMKWKRGLLKELGRSVITTLISPDNQCPDHCSASNIDPPQHIRSCSWSLYNSHLQQRLTPASRSWSRIALHIPLPWKWCHPIKDHLSLNKSCILVEDYHQAKRHFLALLFPRTISSTEEIRYTYHITSLVRLQP